MRKRRARAWLAGARGAADPDPRMWRTRRRIGTGGLDRLSPQDLSNLRVEARGMPMHVAALAILERGCLCDAGFDIGRHVSIRAVAQLGDEASLLEAYPPTSHPHGTCSPTTSGATRPHWQRSARGRATLPPPFDACDPTPPSSGGSFVKGTHLACR